MIFSPLWVAFNAIKPYWIVGKILTQLGVSLLGLRLHSLILTVQQALRSSHTKQVVHPVSNPEF